MNLTDPRRYGDGSAHPLAQLASRDEAARLQQAVSAAVAEGSDDDIKAAYAAVGTRAAYRRLWEAVAAAIEAPPADAAVVTRVFAMPWLLVCGTRAAASLPCVLSDVGELARVMEEAGALGANRNLGFANALCAVETLEQARPSLLRARHTGGGARDFPPAPIDLSPGNESLHLRFLMGAAVSAPEAPGIVETAAHIGTWGIKAAGVMTKQLMLPGVDVLAVPRPPAGIMKAAYAGRYAGLEAAFNLFVSNTLRRFRLKVGDPGLLLSTHEGGELRATLYSPFDEGLTEGYRWPLHPLDDLEAIVASMTDFARECRVLDIATVPGVLPDVTSTGAVLFPTAAGGGAKH